MFILVQFYCQFCYTRTTWTAICT